MGSQAGVKWSRKDFGWGRIEPAKGKFDWTFYDKMVSAAKRNGITIYGELGYWTGWTKPYTPEGIEDYCRYVTAVAAHYRNDVHHWEIWNEPNISWYDFRNDGSDPFNFEHNMGIITRDFRPKPAYRAYATMTACSRAEAQRGLGPWQRRGRIPLRRAGQAVRDGAMEYLRRQDRVLPGKQGDEADRPHGRHRAGPVRRRQGERALEKPDTGIFE